MKTRWTLCLFLLPVALALVAATYTPSVYWDSSTRVVGPTNLNCARVLTNCVLILQPAVTTGDTNAVIVSKDFFQWGGSADVNFNGTVNVADQIAAALLVGSTNWTPEVWARADITGDGRVDLLDVYLIGQIAGSGWTTNQAQRIGKAIEGAAYWADDTTNLIASFNFFTRTAGVHRLRLSNDVNNVQLHAVVNGGLTVSGNHTNIVGTRSSAFGNYAGLDSSDSADSVFTGYQAGYQNTNGNDSVISGREAGRSAILSEDVVWSGREAGKSATNCGTSVYVGYKAGINGSSNLASVFLGPEAGLDTTNCPYNARVGYLSGYKAKQSSHVAAIGYRSGGESSNCYRSSFIGAYAGYLGTNNIFTSFLGQGSGEESVNNTNCVFVGDRSAYRANGNTNTIAIGPYAGAYTTNANNNIFLGYQSGTNTVSTNCVFIGYQSGTNYNGMTNRFELAQRNVNTTPLIYGDFATGDFFVPGSLELVTNAAPTSVTVGTTAPDRWFKIKDLSTGTTYKIPAWAEH